MPPEWSEVQAAFAAALTDARLPLPADVIECGAPGPRRGFAVYRNNSLASLIDALGGRFPVTRRLVGEEFFRAMARVYVSGHRPRSPLLIHYGDDFADFIDTFAPAREVAYLSDIARIEAAWSHAYHAREARSLPARALADHRADDLLEMRLTLHPSTRVLRSRYPIAEIWSAHQGTGAVTPPVRWVPQDVLIVRPDEDVCVHVLAAGRYAFVSALLDRRSVQVAATIASRDSPDFDVGESLADLFRSGGVVALEAGRTQETRQ